MPFDPDVLFNKRALLDFTATDEELHEQLWAFIREGHSGPELIGMIINSPKPGIANHVARLMTILAEKILVESHEKGDAIISSYNND